MRICFTDVLLFFLFFFPSTKTMRQPFSGTAERIFMKLSPNDRGECSLKRRAAAWRKLCRRLANVDLRNIRYDSAAGYGNPQSELRYDSGRITRGHHERRLRYKIMSVRMDLI